MAANPTPASANPCCAALQARCSRLEERRNALREGCNILRDQMSRVEAENRDLKKANEEEHARTDHEKILREKEIDFRKSLESKVAALESQLSCMKQAESTQLQNMNKELMVMQEKVSRKEAEIDRLKQLLKEESGRVSIEQDNAAMERQKVMELSEALETEKKRAAESTTCNHVETETANGSETDKELMVLQEKFSEKEAEIDRLKQLLKEESGRVSIEQNNAAVERQKVMELSEALEAEKKRAADSISCNHVETEAVNGSETDNTVVLQHKELAEEYMRKLTDERSYANNLMKQLEEQTLKVDLLQTELLELRSFRESAEACFAKQLSEKEAELSQLNNHLGAVKSRIDVEQNKAAALKENFALRLSEMEAELNQVKSLLEVEKSRADVERKEAVTLKENLELEKRKYLESYNLAQAGCNRAKDSHAEMDRLKEDVSKLTLQLSKYEDLTKKFDAEKKKALRERQRADAEMVKALELQRLAEENERKLKDERSNSKCLSQRVEEEREKVEMLQKQVQELLLSCKLTADERSDFLNLKRDYSKLEAENAMLIKDRKCIENVNAMEIKKIAGESEKKLMEERSNSELLSQKLEGEREKVETLQKQVHELLLSIKSIASGSDSTKLKELHSKLGDKNKILTREIEHVDPETARADGLTKDSTLNGRNCLEENCSTNLSSLELETCRQRIKELEELQGLKLSRKSVGDYAAPDVNMKTLIHEQLKLEKKRLKHAKQVAKLEKDRNNLLQCELRKLKQDFVQMAQHLGILEDAFCGRTQAVDESTKSSEMLKLQSSNLKKMLFCSNLCGKNEQELVVPGSSTRCGLGTLIPNKEHCQHENSMEMPSGTNANPLLEGPFQAISPNSAMNSSATSFSDKRLLGPQEELAGSLASTTIVVNGNSNPQAKISKPFRQAGKRNHEEHVASVVYNCSRQPLEDVCARSPKRRKPLDVWEPLIHVQSETRKFHKKLEENVPKVISNTRAGDQLEATRYLLSDSDAARLDGPHKKRKLLENSNATLEHPAALPAPKASGSSEPCIDYTSVPESLLLFEKQLDGDFMKLLDLDDEVDEELFRIAIETPISPTLPEVDWESSGLAGFDILNCALDEGYLESLLTSRDIAHVADSINSKPYDHRSSASDLGKYDRVESAGQGEYGRPTGVVPELVCDGTMKSKALVSVSDCAKQTDNSQLGVTVENMPHVFILSASMEDISRIAMVVVAIRRCIGQCSPHSQAGWVLMDLLTALASEQQLTPREKACALFTLGVHDYLRVSLNKSELCFDQGSSCSFSSYLCSAFSDAEKRGIFAEAFDFSELLCLYEDFVAERKVLCKDESLESVSDISLRFDIPLEDKVVALYGKAASTREVVAGSVIISSICLAADRTGVLCDVSFNILRLLPVVPQLILHILHCFACLCGEGYFSISNCSMQMEVVKCMVSILESTHEDQSATLSSGCHTRQPYPMCDRCPLLGSLQPLDLLSLISEELQIFASVPLVRVSKDHFCRYFDVMSSLELISTIMGWSWTIERVLPELQKLLESCIEGNLSAPLVLLLGRIGRLGVISHGYEDAGVEIIRQYLSSLPIKISGLSRKRALASALAFAVREISAHDKKQGAMITGVPAVSTPVAKALLVSGR